MWHNVLQYLSPQLGLSGYFIIAGWVFILYYSSIIATLLLSLLCDGDNKRDKRTHCSEAEGKCYQKSSD